MPFTDNTAQDQSAAITFDYDLRHPPERVWRVLTDPELLAEWLLPTMDFKLEPGTAFRLQAPPLPEWDGVVSCELLEVEEQRRLRYSWLVGDMDTVVTFTLTPTSTGTHLSLVHEGFKPSQKHNFAGARYGWRLMSQKLVDLLDRG